MRLRSGTEHRPHPRHDAPRAAGGALITAWIIRQLPHRPREPASPPAAQGFAGLVRRLWPSRSKRYEYGRRLLCPWIAGPPPLRGGGSSPRSGPVHAKKHRSGSEGTVKRRDGARTLGRATVKPDANERWKDGDETRDTQETIGEQSRYHAACVADLALAPQFVDLLVDELFQPRSGGIAE
jgi:hypothetical protein